MLFKLFLLLISISLFGQEVIWDGNSNNKISQKKYTKIIENYIKIKYPKEVENYRKNSLMWQNIVEINNNAMNWVDSKFYCEKLKFDGYANWRLPRIDELQDHYSTIPRGYSISGYWSSSINF